MLHSDPNLLSVLLGNPNIKSTLVQGESHLKRLVDIVLSLFGILLFFPFLPLVALLIKLDSKGPVFYPADRVGRNFKNFRMWKFRTMIDTPIEVGESVSPQFDPRVTPVGRFLRRTKINELPQLVNVLKGEMTFVGPRPEAPDLAALYPEEAKKVFSAKPGLVGPAAILGRNEEEVYPPGVDVKKYYIENILPNKTKIDLEYIENQSLLKDIKHIIAGVKVTLVGAIGKRHFHDNWSQICLLLSDALIITCSYLCACIFYSWSLSAEVNWAFAFFTLPIVILVRLVWNIYFSMYSSLIRYISYNDIAGVFKGVSAGSFSLVLIAYALGWIHYQGIIAAIDWVFLILFLSSLRLILRLYWDITHRKNDQRKTRRILIYGVCDEGNAACRAITSDRYFPFEIVGFIDDAPGTFGKTVNGRKVLGDRHHIIALARLYRVEEILIAKRGMKRERVAEIKAICERANVRCRIWNSWEGVDATNRATTGTGPIHFRNVLHIKPCHVDTAAAGRILNGKTVLINGPAGALGLELCRRMLQLGSERLLILDYYESCLNEVVADLMSDVSPERIVPVLTAGMESGIQCELFGKYRPSIVVQAGMRKYPSFLGLSLDDIGRTNYRRTFDLAKAAAEFDCETFLVISALTSNSRSFVADSLRVAEASLKHYFSDTNTRLVVARVGDVIENRGGVFSIIEERIRNRKTVVLPKPESQACCISKDDGAKFILQCLVDAGSERDGRKALFFDCNAGSMISLIQLSEKLAECYGVTLGRDVPVKYFESKHDPHYEQGPANYPVDHDDGNSVGMDTGVERLVNDLVRDVDWTKRRDLKGWTRRAAKACESSCCS